MYYAEEKGFAMGFYAYHRYLIKHLSSIMETPKKDPEIEKILKLVEVLGSSACEILDNYLIDKVTPFAESWESIYKREAETKKG